jgi:hypothetical protein
MVNMVNWAIVDYESGQEHGCLQTNKGHDKEFLPSCVPRLTILFHGVKPPKWMRGREGG